MMTCHYMMSTFYLRRNENINNLKDPRPDSSAPAEETPINAAQRSSRLHYSKKGMMKALKMSILHVVTFLFLWTPYTVMATWY